jgi:aminoglycoside phosphotransferase (APT) family kinase protein
MEQALETELITIELARKITLSANCASDPTEIKQLQGGSTDVYRVDFADGTSPLVLKLYADEPSWFMKKEKLVASWIGDRIGVPVPCWLVQDDSRRLLSRQYAIMTWLPGVLVRSLIGSSGAKDALRQMGAALRQLHDIPMTAYGYIGSEAISRPWSSNSEYMGSAVEAALRRFRDVRGDADLVRKLKSKIDERSDVFACNVKPVLCHCDFHQGNVLVARDERGQLKLTGLIDFADASAADPLLDLAYGLFSCTHEDPKSREPLLAGYGEIEHPDSEGALWLYTLHHRVVMWAHLKRLSIQGRRSDPVELLRDLSEMCG